jgi:hypothetical protein
VRDGLLLTALAVALTTLDARTSLATLWSTLPMALLAAALTLSGPKSRPWRWRNTGTLGLLGMALGARAWASLIGPMPSQGLREAMDLGVILTLAAALWQMAAGTGRRATALWICALLVGWLAEWWVILHAKTEAGDALAARLAAGGSPAGRMTMGLGALLGLAMLAGSWLTRPRRHAGAHLKPPVGHSSSARVAALGLGMVVGYWLSRLPKGLSFEMELPLAAGRDALPYLWLQSLLIGWGRHALEPLGSVLAEPHAAAFHPWGGPWALLAMGGLLGVGLLLFLIATLLERRGGAAAIALLMGGLILGGGPLSGVVLLTFAGWTALALAPSGRRWWPGPRWMPRTIGATGIAAIALTLMTVLLGMPARGDRLLKRGMDGSRPWSERERLLAWAEGLNPCDPAIPMQRAATLRERMNRTPGWSESLYQAVIDAYRRAQRLNPYETLFPLTMAQFQMLCARRDAAIQTVEAALARQPYAADPCEWLFLTALRLDRAREAWRALDRGLKMRPMRPVWWLRQYELAKARDQRALAGRSLCIALTADPENARLAGETWGMFVGAETTPRPGVQLPDRPDAIGKPDA